MKIIKLAPVEKTNNKFCVIFEDGTELKVSTAQIADFGLYSGLEIPDDEYDRLMRGLKLVSSKSRAIRILGSRNLSSREIGKRLVSKGESAEDAQETVKWLENIGAVNDAEYALQIVKHYCGKGYGAARIRDELFRRGIPGELWDEALSALDTPDGVDNVEEATNSFLEKKLRGSDDKDDLRRAADALIRRGFSYEEAKAAVRRYADEIRS